MFHYPGGLEKEYQEFDTDLSIIEQGRGYWFNAVEVPAALKITAGVIQANQGKDFEWIWRRAGTRSATRFLFPSIGRMSKPQPSRGIEINLGLRYRYPTIRKRMYSPPGKELSSSAVREVKSNFRCCEDTQDGKGKSILITPTF